MKKILLSLMGLFIALGMYAGDKTVSIDFSAQNYKNGDEVQMVMIDDNVSIALDKGTNSNTPKYYTTGEAVRLYGSNTMTITTASGVLKSVELTFDNGGGTNEITADCGEFKEPNWTGSSAAVILTVGGTSGHRRVKTVTVTYGEAGSAPVAVEGVSITDAQGNALGYSVNLTQGETLQVKAAIDPASASNKNVTWEILQEGDIISFENNTVTALNPGRAAMVVTTEDGEHQAFTYIYVSAPEKSTVADFIASKGGACYLTGVVSDFVSTVYGNFTLTDATGSIYVYGCLTPAGEKKQFESLGVKEGNEITVLASKYQLFKETHEAVDVVFVENHGTPSSGSEYTFDVKAGKTNFSVVPSVDDVKYYVEIISAGYSAEEVTGYFDQIFDEMGDGLEYFSGMINQSYAKDWYIDEDGDYVIAVCAVSDDNKRMGAVTLVPFTIGGGEEPMGNYSFQVTPGKTNFTVIPSDENVKYYMEVIGAGYSTAEIAGYFDMMFEEMGDGLDYFSGIQNQSYAKDWWIDEEGDYVIAVCAVSDDNKRVSEVTVVPFTIGGEDEPVGNYSFEVVAGKEDFTVTPSDENVKYYMEVIGAGYSAEEITGYFDMMFDEMGSGLEYFTGVQTQNYAEDWWIDEEGDYVIAVCAVSADNKRLSAVTVVPFTISAEAEETETTVAISSDIFKVWDGVGADAKVVGDAGCAMNFGVETDCPYGDTSLPETHYADLSAYSKLVVTYTTDMPRIFFNKVDGGNQPMVSEKSNTEYYTLTQNADGSKTGVVDLKKWVADKGFAHLNGIKASAWNTKVTVTEIYLVKEAEIDEPVAFDPEFVYSIEDGAEVDAAETRSIHLDVLVEGMTDEDLFIEGKIYGKNFESPVIAYTDFEEGMDIDVSRLADGIYTIEITKVAGGDVVGVTEDWMPIYEHQLEAEDGKALSTITFTLSVPQAEPVAVEYAVNPKSGSTVESLEQVTLQFTDDTAVGNGMITVKKDGQEIAKIDAEAIFPDDWFAPVTDFILPVGATEPGKYTIEIPEGYFQQGMGEVNVAAITLTYTIEEPAEMAVVPSLFSGVVGSIDTALNGHAAVSAEVAEGLRVEIANCPQAIGVSFMLNEMKMGQDEEGTFWTVGKELAVGEIEMTRDSYAAFDAPIYFYGGTKYQLTVTVYAEVGGEPAEIATYTYEFNGAAAPQSGSVADGIDAIKQGAADGKYMKGGKVVIVKNGKTYTVAGQRTK